MNNIESKKEKVEIRIYVIWQGVFVHKEYGYILLLMIQDYNITYIYKKTLIVRMYFENFQNIIYCTTIISILLFMLDGI